MKFSIQDIARILQVPVPSGSPREISCLLTDSRSLLYPEKTLFFAIRTSTNDGHRYIRQLYDRGVRAFCVSYVPEEMKPFLSEAIFLTVNDPTLALQKIAAERRRLFSGTMIGVTGSRGKTTVKEWIHQLLASDYKIVRSPRSYNSQIGVPLSIWEITDSTMMAVIEAGISRRGEMERLAEIIAPQIGIFTNINSEHSEGFHSIQQKAREKAILFRGADHVIFCADDPTISKALSEVCSDSHLFGWSTTDAHAPLFISQIIPTGHGSTIIRYESQGFSSEAELPFTSNFHIQNAIHCLALMLIMEVPNEVIAERIASLTAVGTRLNVIEGVNDCMIIQDSYTSDLHSLAPALDFMARRRTTSRGATVILSDVMHESMNASRLYKAVASLLRSRDIDRIIGIGEEFMAQSRIFGPESSFYPDTATFLSEVSPDDFQSELILVKGAPQFHFERIIDRLEARQHETVLEVNLDSLVHNFNWFRSRLRPTTGIVCMLKASGYGAGSYELAKTLQSQGAAYIAVAVVDEGVGLRRAGITMPIMVLNPRADGQRSLFAYGLEPEIFSFDILHEIIREGEKYGVTDHPVHIKFDTGMHRLGFLESDIPELIDILRRQKVVRPVSAFSHLAAADDPSMDDYTHEQFAIFERCCNALQAAFRHHIMRHILNSTGITRFPEEQHDMVRLGICLYGIPTLDDGSQNGLTPISTLTSTVISIKEWPAGTTIGYNRRGVCTRPSRIATIPVGYADGINRHLGRGAMKVWSEGHLCPTIGNICMDACMIDVTDAPEVEVGSRVEIFGPHIPVCELAATLDTIPYEILTSVSDRVKRIYYRE